MEGGTKHKRRERCSARHANRAIAPAVATGSVPRTWRTLFLRVGSPRARRGGSPVNKFLPLIFAATLAGVVAFVGCSKRGVPHESGAEPLSRGRLARWSTADSIQQGGPGYVDVIEPAGVDVVFLSADRGGFLPALLLGPFRRSSRSTAVIGGTGRGGRDVRPIAQTSSPRTAT